MSTSKGVEERKAKRAVNQAAKASSPLQKRKRAEAQERAKEIRP